MGYLSNSRVAKHDGCTIEVESSLISVWNGVHNFSLIINDERVDSTQACGACSLRGRIPAKTNDEKRVVVRITQGPFLARFKCEVDGVEVPMEKMY